jgi:hypothetical protein
MFTRSSWHMMREPSGLMLAGRTTPSVTALSMSARGTECKIVQVFLPLLLVEYIGISQICRASR